MRLPGPSKASSSRSLRPTYPKTRKPIFALTSASGAERITCCFCQEEWKAEDATWNALFQDGSVSEYMKGRCYRLILRRLVSPWVKEQWIDKCSKTSLKLLIGLSLTTVGLEMAWVSQIGCYFLHFELSGELRPVRINIQRYLVSFVLRWLSEASSRMARKGLAGMAWHCINWPCWVKS